MKTKMTNESLIAKEQAQREIAPFFPNFELPEVDRSKRKFHCTGERLFRDRPDVYKAVVRMLAEPGVTILNICRTLHVTDDVVRSVKERENISIAQEKKTVLANITHGLRLASERVIELMPEAPVRDALIGVGILGEKMQLLDGEPTARINTNQHIDFDALFEELRREAEETMKLMKAGVIGVGEKIPQQKALMARDHEENSAAGNEPRSVVQH